MGHLLTTFFWNNPSFSGTGQLDLGPFFVGTVNKFFKLETRGRVNFQAFVIDGLAVEVNNLAWGVQQVPHGGPANDVVTSTDNDTWFIRRMVGTNDLRMFWAPDTDNAQRVGDEVVDDDWAGQLAIGADTDLFISFKATAGLGIANYNTFGTIRLWWS